MRIEWDRYRVRLGNVGRKRWVRGLIITTDWSHGGMTVTDQDLLFFWAGHGRIRLRSGWAKVEPGVCVWARPGWTYHAEQDPNDPLGNHFIHFNLVDCRGRVRPARAPLPPEIIHPPDPQFVEAATRRIVELCYGFDLRGYSSPPFSHSVTESASAILTAILKDLDCAMSPRPGRAEQDLLPHHDRIARRAALQIASDLQETPTVADLARVSGYSANHFTRIFKQVMGCGPELYAVRLRVERAKLLLLETARPIAEIADIVGYGNVYFFSRQFKQFAGVSPLHYRLQGVASVPATQVVTR
ncbi:MAG: AraC family transcriptional regulator [Kiritimatiellae bacterium]|nr:AraC family transcriptional regulator [Kiritimatiellia bacterium]